MESELKTRLDFEFEAGEEVTQKQIDSFNRNGFIVVRNALDTNQVDHLLDVIMELKADLERSEHRRDTYGLNIRPVVDKHDAFLDLLECPTTFPKAVRFLQHFNLQLFTSHLIMVPPDPERRAIGWHPDGGKPGIGFYGRRALATLKVGYFLRDLKESNMGALMVVPGSNRMDGGPSFLNGGDPVGGMELKVAAGDAVIFGQPTWHASAPNHSNQDRVALYYGYGYRILRPIDYETMPREILDKCSPIGRQLLGHKSSHLGFYLPTDEDVPLREYYRERWGETWQDL